MGDPQGLKVAVVGHRKYLNRFTIFRELTLLKKKYGVSLLATVDDKMGFYGWISTWCKRNKVERVVYKEPTRNTGSYDALTTQAILMLEEIKPDILVAFPGKRYRRYIVLAAMQRDIPVKLVKDDRWVVPQGIT